jgi:hypothetical protein
MKLLDSIYKETKLMNKEESQTYGNWIEINTYIDKKTENYRISYYVPKLNDKDLNNLVKGTVKC